MKKHTLVMSCKDYFLVKNYLVELRQQGKFDYDAHMMKFYKSFAMNSSIKLDRKAKGFDSDATVIFELDDDHTLLATVGLFCREHSMDQRTKDKDLANVLYNLKNYIAAELEDYLGL